jgi:hypothetical protein
MEILNQNGLLKFPIHPRYSITLLQKSQKSNDLKREVDPEITSNF